MGNLVTDLITLFFAKRETFISKAEEFRAEREHRYLRYKEHVQGKEEEPSEKKRDELHRLKELFFDLSRKFGFVRKTELDELEGKIKELKDRIAEMERGKKES